MAKRTNKYGLTFFEHGDFTSAKEEMQRWETIDAQLEALFSIMGNGVINGWTISSIDDGGLSCAINPGKGHVGFVAVESTNNVTVSLIPDEINYIYAQLTADSYWTKSVNFVAFIDKLETDTAKTLYLGSVTTDADSVTNIDSSDRKELGFLELINNAVSSHKHNGAEGNPDPVDLSKEVQGILGQEHLPEIDASLIQSGTLDEDRLPLIDHETKITNNGILTHAQLDSYVETLSLENQSLMGEVSTVNLLQLILALKHIYPDIDEFLVNEIAFIPGISPDDYIDTENTTAEVDTRPYSEGGQHTITGVADEGFKAYTRQWGTKENFNNGTLHNTIVVGNTVTIEAIQNELSIDEFNDVNSWTVSTHDLSSIDSQLGLDGSNYIQAPTSAKLAIGAESIDVQLLLAKTFDNQDWDNYNFLNFYIYTDNVHHGDLFFYIRDAEYGEQKSSQKILNRNAPTIDEDTLLSGWQEISIDLREFNRENINEIGFYVDTQEGWDFSHGFDLNIDSVRLLAGNVYYEDGYARVTYGSNLYVNFWRLRWDASIPSDALSSGVGIQARTRVANTAADLNNSQWSSYTSVSGSDIELPSESLYKYIEIEIYFSASTNKKRSAVLNSIELDYYAVDTNSSFDFSSQEDWENGSSFNIDSTTWPGTIRIKGVEDFGDTIYGAEGKANQIDEDSQEKYSIVGSLLPRNTNQVSNKESPSLGTVTAVVRGNEGNIWMADTSNDRVVEVDVFGNLVQGFYGSFIEVPIDYYGVEDAGPGSNVVDVSSVDGSDNTNETTALSVLHSLYNSSEGCLYIVFNKNLENIYASSAVFDVSKMHLKVGGHKIWLNESTVELAGVDEENYNRWKDLDNKTEAGKFINQFKFTSHVLKVSIKGADKTLLDYMVDQKKPSVAIASPKPQKRLTGDVTVRFLLYNFDLGTQSGENGIQIALDGVSQTIYSDRITFSGLSEGEHTLDVKLEKADGSLHTNDEAQVSSSFVVGDDSYALPHMTIDSPCANQIYSSNPVSIVFSIDNFPVIPSGQHIKYQIDNNASKDYYSTDPIVLENLEVGKHTIKLWTVDEQGATLDYDYGEIESDFIIGLNPYAAVKLYVNADAVADINNSSLSQSTILYVDVANVKFVNLYAPIDIQLMTEDIDKNGLPTIVVAKLRSLSSTQYLAGASAETETINRAQKEAGGEGIELNSVYDGVATANLIYGSKFMDGHSVVQMNMDGEILFSNNAAVFASAKKDAIDMLGSVEKINDTELLIGDSINKRAIIVDVDSATQIPSIVWQYDSDRFVADFHLNIQNEREIDIYDDYVSDGLTYIRQNTNIIWTNKSSTPVSIYSGSTSYETFNASPNLNLYGDVFSSSVLQPGDSYSFEFEETGEYPWFVYPSIVTATIQVNKRRLSSQDQYFILESDGFDSPFSSRLIKVDSWGNVVWSFGESYMIKPRDVRPMLDNKVLISV